MSKEPNDLLKTLKVVLVPIHPAGWVFIATFAFVAFILALFSAFLGWLGFIATIWCIYFFRNPNRITPVREGLIISPADGIVQKIVQVPPPAVLNMGEEPRTRISIFLNVFNVHVNRVPATGTVTATHYHPGLFLNASLDKASEDNERQLVKMALPDGRDLAFVQIAGLVARRIICELTPNQAVRAGERFGLIRFGSRMDVYLPAGVQPQVVEGQTAVAGETVLADMQSTEAARIGVIN